MAVKLADTLAPMGDFEIAQAKDISVEIDGETVMLQDAIDEGKVGGAIDDESTTATDKSWSAKKISDSLVDKASFNLVGKDIYNGDLNSIKYGVYRVSGVATNTPTGNSGYLTCIVRDEGKYVSQTYHAENNIMYQRTCVNGTWSDWRELATMDKVKALTDSFAVKAFNQTKTDILAYALTCDTSKRSMVRIHSTDATNNPFGAMSDTDFVYTIDKIDDKNSWISIQAKDVRTNRLFVNTKNNEGWLGWREI